MNASSTVGAPSSIASTAYIPSLERATITAYVNGNKSKTLVHTGSFESFIRENKAQMMKLKILPRQSMVSMASTTFSTPITGSCIVTLKVSGRFYEKVNLNVLPGLCSDIILEQDFIRRHESVCLQFGGEEPALRICGLSSLNIMAPSLFANLKSPCTPITVKSRRHSTADQVLISHPKCKDY